MRNSNGSAALWQKRKSVDITNSFRYSPPSDRRNPSGNRRGIPRCERHRPEKADKYAAVFLQVLHPERSRISPKTKSKVLEKENISFPKRQNPSADGKGKSQRYERNDSGRTDGVHRHRNKSVFPLSEKSKSAACQRSGPAGGKHLCRQGFGKDGEKRNRIPKPACRCKSGI